MKLYITPGSPYARMARIVVLEKGLQDRVEIIPAKTRVADSPYYDINPSGRVPYLVCDGGLALEESAIICAYLDRLDGKPALGLPDGDRFWEAQRLEALARSLLDGLSVWLREILRPENERSANVMRHETERARRMIDVWERQIGHPAPFPEELPHRLIQLYTFKGDVVLDPFAGSGTTCVAAFNDGRNYVGDDIDEGYVKLAESRLETAKNQQLASP